MEFEASGRREEVGIKIAKSGRTDITFTSSRGRRERAEEDGESGDGARKENWDGFGRSREEGDLQERDQSLKEREREKENQDAWMNLVGGDGRLSD